MTSKLVEVGQMSSMSFRRTQTTISVILFLFFNLNQKAIELNNRYLRASNQVYCYPKGMKKPMFSQKITFRQALSNKTLLCAVQNWGWHNILLKNHIFMQIYLSLRSGFKIRFYYYNMGFIIKAPFENVHFRITCYITTILLTIMNIFVPV